MTYWVQNGTVQCLYQEDKTAEGVLPWSYPFRSMCLWSGTALSKHRLLYWAMSQEVQLIFFYFSLFITKKGNYQTAIYSSQRVWHRLKYNCSPQGSSQVGGTLAMIGTMTCSSTLKGHPSLNIYLGTHQTWMGALTSCCAVIVWNTLIKPHSLHMLALSQNYWYLISHWLWNFAILMFSNRINQHPPSRSE